MNQLKGFSLIEVLVSLMLVSVVALFLLQQQDQSRQLLTRLVLLTVASQYLDQVDESLFAGLPQYPSVPAPYLFTIQNKSKNIILELKVFNHARVVTRKYSQFRAF